MPSTRIARPPAAALGVALGMLLASSCGPKAVVETARKTPGAAEQAAKLAVTGNSRQLRERPEGAPRNSPGRPGILLLNIDGVDRSLLYRLVREGRMPHLARLLGGGGAGGFPHAHFDDRFIATMPSSTMVAWVTALTGVGPARHGVAGNEFFIREKRVFAAPVPVTLHDPTPVMKCFTEDYVDKFRLAPSVYERMRERDPNVLVWVAMQQFHAGADRLLLTDRTVFAKAFEIFLEEEVEKRFSQKESRDLYAELDEAVVDAVVGELDESALPDVLTVYVSGTDSFAHVADGGPDAARSAYLREILDPQFGRLAERLEELGALEDRFVVLTSDHGHTAIVDDDAHALATDDEDDPPALLEKAGFRVRPFELEVDDDADFQAVLAYQGAVAYVYAADRSTCPEEGDACDWSRPPRFREDVLALAEAFYRNNRDGSLVPAMKGTLDMVLTRKPAPAPEDDLPFEVYVGGGKLVPIEAWLKENPRPTYVELSKRMRDLGEGKHGERAGDVVLVANNGNVDKPEDRYYFASRYRSWHGSPSRQDSELPLVVAHRKKSAGELAKTTGEVLGQEPFQQKLTDLLLVLRYGRDAVR